MTDKPRAKTPEEARAEFLQALAAIAHYWAKDDRTSNALDKCNGVVFSVLNLIDGGSGGFCAVNLAVDPHESDKKYHEERGENWFEPGQVINADVALHESWFNYARKD